jgi:EAL domain-containing protein (putative c-di-GMP-specific phosphodiesterase class I)
MHMARALNYSVVAEGIETQKQMQILRSLGVDYLQGYYFAKPLAIEQVEQLISAEQVPKLIAES